MSFLGLVRSFGSVVAAVSLLASGPALASVRPGSAVPTGASASSVNSSAQYNARRSSMTPWPAYLTLALTFAVAVWIAVDDGEGEIAISRG